MKIRKAVITAAGFGTRFLPITRTQPKEMLPLVDKPLIQYAVEEAVNSGIDQIIMVTSENKRAIEDYFKRSPELEAFLERKGDPEQLRKMLEISSLADIRYVRQKEQLGLGHAVLMAKDLIGDEPFALMLPDDIISSGAPGLRQMLPVYEKYRCGVVAVEKVVEQDTGKYGIIDSQEISGGVYRVKGLVEKPEPALAPSRLGIIGRYILPSCIFEVLEHTLPGKSGEIQLTDALNALLNDADLYACELEGVRYDAGTPLGWLKANLALGLKHENLAPELKEYIKQLLK